MHSSHGAQQNKSTRASHLLSRVVLFGPAASGKSQILNQIINGKFDSRYVETDGVDSGKKNITTIAANEKEQIVRLDIWDLSGHERYRNLVTAYFRGIDAAVFVLDSTKTLAEQNVAGFYEDFKKFAPDEVIPLIVINKKDLADEQKLTDEDVRKIRKTIGLDERDASHEICVSAKTQDGIDDLSTLIAKVSIECRLKNTDEMARLTNIAESKSQSATLPAEDTGITLAFRDAEAMFSSECKVFKNLQTRDGGRAFRTYLENAGLGISDDFKQGKIEKSEALKIATTAKKLAAKVADCTVTADCAELNAFRKAVQAYMTRSSQFRLTVGGILRAIGRVILGAVVGAKLGSSLGSIGLVAGAVGGAALSGPIYGRVHNKATLWRHPLSAMERAANQVAATLKKDRVLSR